VRDERTLRVDALVAARDSERRSVGGEDRSAADGGRRVTRVVAVLGERRRVDDLDPELAQREQREQRDEDGAQPRDRAIGQDASPVGRSPARSRSSV
jgi:hypothetical protein